jgi:hypothetical protein
MMHPLDSCMRVLGLVRRRRRRGIVNEIATPPDMINVHSVESQSNDRRGPREIRPPPHVSPTHIKSTTRNVFRHKNNLTETTHFEFLAKTPVDFT